MNQELNSHSLSTEYPFGTFSVHLELGINGYYYKNSIQTDAQKWARLIESEIDRGIFIDRSEAERTIVGQLIERYIQEKYPP